MADINAPLSKKSKVSKKGVHVPPQLMKIVQEVAGDGVSGDVTAAVTAVQCKALRALDSYLNCVCIRMRG